MRVERDDAGDREALARGHEPLQVGGPGDAQVGAGHAAHVDRAAHVGLRPVDLGREPGDLDRPPPPGQLRGLAQAHRAAVDDGVERLDGRRHHPVERRGERQVERGVGSDRALDGSRGDEGGEQGQRGPGRDDGPRHARGLPEHDREVGLRRDPWGVGPHREAAALAAGGRADRAQLHLPPPGPGHVDAALAA